MHVGKFWEAIARHPWLLEHIALWDSDPGLDLRKKYSNFIDLAKDLAIEIPQMTSWIAMRPFSKRILNQQPIEDGTRVTKELVLDIETSWHVRWHAPGQNPFTNCDDVSRGRTVGDTLEKIRDGHPGAVIDAILHCEFGRRGQTRKKKGGTYLLKNRGESYNIYLVAAASTTGQAAK